MDQTANRTNYSKIFIVLAAFMVATALAQFTGALSRQDLPVSADHHVVHTPELSPAAQATLGSMMSRFASPGGDPNSRRCFVLQVAGETARWMVWVQTHINPTSGIARGDFAVFDRDGWLTVFSGKTETSLSKIPADLSDRPDISVKEIPGCNGLPPLPPLPPMVGG